MAKCRRGNVHQDYKCALVARTIVLEERIPMAQPTQRESASSSKTIAFWEEAMAQWWSLRAPRQPSRESLGGEIPAGERGLCASQELPPWAGGEPRVWLLESLKENPICNAPNDVT